MRTVSLLLLLIPAFANAFEVCWQNPTENVDGTPLTDLVSVNLRVGTQPGGPYDVNTVNYPTTEPGASLCTDVEAPPGDYFVVATAVDVDGNESTFSNQVIKTEIDTTPQTPIILPETRTVFTVIKQPDRFVLLPIGTVPPGTECDPNNSVNGHGVVPVESVIWNVGSTARPIVVVARCDG